MKSVVTFGMALLLAVSRFHSNESAVAGSTHQVTAQTKLSLVDTRWHLNGKATYAGSPAEGLLMNVRMVNAVFEDANERTCPVGFDPDANTAHFINKISDYMVNGMLGFTISLQGGDCGYEDAINSAFSSDGSLRQSYLDRVERVIQACDRHGAVVILTCYYQRQDQLLKDEGAIRDGVKNTAKWIRDSGYANVVLEIANEFGHPGFNHSILKKPDGMAELISLAKKTAPGLLVSASGLGDGALPDAVIREADFLLIHFNNTPSEEIHVRIAALKKHRKAIVCNEDNKIGSHGAQAVESCVKNGVSWGLMLLKQNQHFPFTFNGPNDDPVVYDRLKRLTINVDYYPPGESQGGWRMLVHPEDIRQRAGMDPEKLEALKEWLLQSDDRDFAAVVICNGYLVLEVERGNSAKTDSRRVASVSKAICATVLAIASEQSQQGRTPMKMKFEDHAFDYIPWAHPLSDPRKARITIRQLLNHTSGICPEATGADNDGKWEYILGHTGDERTVDLAFDPGTACGYSTHALAHASLICETVTGKPYDQFAIEALFEPLGIEHWWFQYYDGDEKTGRHPSHGLGMPARDLARIAYCMLHEGCWQHQQIIPKWFVVGTAAPPHAVTTPEMRWKINPQVFTDGWELPARHWPETNRIVAGIPEDSRYKPGSGGQLIAFVPSLDLVITRQTGGSGSWQYEEYLRRACEAVIKGIRHSSIGSGN